MPTPTEKLESFLRNFPEVEYSRLSDHHSGDWVQTTLNVKVRTGRLRWWKETEVPLGILDHVSGDGLRAKLYSEDYIIEAFPDRQHQHVADVYQRLADGLQVLLEYDVQELPREEDVGMHIMMWG